MVDSSVDFDLSKLGGRVHDLRTTARLSLDELSGRAGVSRSMLAAVESGAKAPTVLVLHKIATGLGTSMSRLLDGEQTDPVILIRRSDQTVFRDPTGWERRNLAPNLPDSDFEFMRSSLPTGIDAGTFPPHAPGSREVLAVESGVLMLTLDQVAYMLEAGDSITYAADVAHGFRSVGPEPCVYYLAVLNGTRGGRA